MFIPNMAFNLNMQIKAALPQCMNMQRKSHWILLIVYVHILCWNIGHASKNDDTEVTILDTTVEDALDWVVYKNINSTGRGWTEVSSTLEGETVRVNTVCDISQTSNVANWLRTRFIERGKGNRLYIEMKFTMRKCAKFPDPERLQQCKESFKLLYYEADDDIATDQMPSWDIHAYKWIDVIAADEMFSELDEVTINYEVRSLPVTSKGVYFAFYDEGACATIMSVRVYYKICPSVSLNFANFPDTTAGPELTSIIDQKGACVAHAAIEQPPSYLCKSDGSWYYPQGGCKCLPGYQPDGTDTQCKGCPEGQYKWRTGSQECKPCPAHSEAPQTGSVECQCKDGYFRNIRDEKSMACTQPPSEPRNLTVTFKDQTMVNLSWQHPYDLGGRLDLQYKVTCVGCEPLVSFHPKKEGFNSTSVSIQGLDPDSEYRVILFVTNGVSSVGNKETDRRATLTFKTEPAIPQTVTKLKTITVGIDYVSLSWEPPVDPQLTVERYKVRYYTINDEDNANHIDTYKPNVTITNLSQQTKYHFKVRAKTTKGWSEYSDHITVTTGQEIEDKQRLDTTANNNLGIIVGSAIAVLICLIIVIIMIVIFLRKNHLTCNEKNMSDTDTLQYSNVHCPHVLDSSHMVNGGLTMPLFTQSGGVRIYIDPHTYEDPNQAVREFTKEIDVSCITIESVIGGGEFGDVCKGKLRTPAKKEICVAIKTLKAGASDKNRLDFLTEASIMGQFDDPNVIYLEGVVTKSNPIMIVTEYMENGSLDAYLRNNDGKFTVIQLVGMMRGIASGMRYLSDMGYVHRDLAARNILVNENLVCKVADFGLSREIESDDTDGAYTTKGGKIPVRWTAPEAIAYRKFTSASDVWSYGVVMWEITSYGERPYWNWSNQDVIKAVDKGFRLPPPMDCPEATYTLMLDTWQKERNQRPKFSAIVKRLDKLIRSPELLRKLAEQRLHQFIDPNHPDLTSYASVEEWLQSIKMERYIQQFLDAGVTTMDHVTQITKHSLQNTLGVTLVGHQKKIMNSVQTLRAHLSNGAQMSEGFLV